MDNFGDSKGGVYGCKLKQTVFLSGFAVPQPIHVNRTSECCKDEAMFVYSYLSSVGLPLCKCAKAGTSFPPCCSRCRLPGTSAYHPSEEIKQTEKHAPIIYYFASQ